MARAHVLLEDYQTIVHALKVNSPRYSKSPFKATWESEETVEDVGCSVQINSIAFGIATSGVCREVEQPMLDTANRAQGIVPVVMYSAPKNSKAFPV